jgi:colicin import membrane protein
MGLALVLAVIVHILLVIALSVAVRWRHHSVEIVTVEAQLWSELPVQAAPPPPPPPPPLEETVVSPPPPPVEDKPAPAPVPDPAIVLAERKAAEKKEALQKAMEEKKRKAKEDERKQAQREEDKKKTETLKAKADKAKEEKTKLAKAEQAKKLEEAKAREETAQSEQRLKEATERALRLAGASGSGSATGTASHSSGPTAKYGAKVVAAIRPNISQLKEFSASLMADYAVYTDASGKVISAKLVKPSGDPAWDEVALNAILKTDRLPLDENGRVPSPMTIGLKPRD